MRAWLQYRRDGFHPFEDYCRVRWKMERRYADRLIACGHLEAVLSPTGLILPTNERVARELLPLKEPELIVQAWTEAVDTAPIENGEPIVTAK